MAQYLSDEWFEEMQMAAAGNSVEGDFPTLSMREVVTDAPNGLISYVLDIENGQVSFVRNTDDETDVTFTQSWDTAVALHKGELTIHDAFFAGRIRVAGKLNALLKNADVLQGLSPAFATVKANTTY